MHYGVFIVNILAVAKKSLLGLSILASVQLVAMKIDSSKERKNVLLVIECHEWLKSNVIKYNKRLSADCLSNKQLRRNRERFDFFMMALFTLRHNVEVLGVENVGAVIAYNMNKNKRRLTI
jgi:hypothetical protein